MSPSRPTRRISVVALLGVALLLLAACGSDDKTASASGSAASSGGGSGASAPTKVVLGYFPNITHAPAIIGVEKGLFQAALGQNTLETQTFNAGGDAVTALLSGAIDATFVGPNPAINAYAKSDGEAIRIVSGSARPARAYTDRDRVQRGFSSSTAARAAALSVNHVASIAV